MASSRRVRIIIEVETDAPLKTLETIWYAETARPDPYWLEPEDERQRDEEGDYHRHSIPILAVTAEEVSRG